MKQLLQRLDNGETRLVDVPVPGASGQSLVVESRASLISAGTERMLVEFGRAGLIDKARQQPDKVRQVLDKMRTDGIAATLDAVRSKLENPIPLGYCNAGVVVQVGPDVRDFAPGDRVVTNASHAEYARVSSSLAVRVPEDISFEAASFTPVAAIGLQGIRLAQPTLGETVVVYGLGLIGLLTVQLLRANGCRVIGIDRDDERLDLAGKFGAVPLDGRAGNLADRVVALSEGIGADAVLLTLASDSDEPVHEAAQMSRKRGRIVLVGVTGLRLSRDDFFKKELSFQVSCSYGPGRYDPEYEERGHDYPLPYVRWTERRNFDAVLSLMASGQLDVAPLISHRFDFERAPDAYDVLQSGSASLGIVLTYPDRGGMAPAAAQRTLQLAPAASHGAPSIGVIGAGNFATRTLLPALRDAGARLHTVVSAGGASARVAGEKFGFERVATDIDAVLGDPTVDCVFVLTRHDSHAALVARALMAGKHVFVEKPLAITGEQLALVEDALKSSRGLLTVGFNRRFAPLTAELRSLLAARAGPLSLVITVNAGAISRDHWTQDPRAGGGRIVGEACHFIDLARALVGAPIASLDVVAARDGQGRPIDDLAHLSLRFADGSTAAVHYLSSGSKAFPKERVEAFFDGKTVAIDNWRRLRRYGAGPSFAWPRAQDKGHAAEMLAWVTALKTGAAPIHVDEVLEVSRWSIRAAELALKS